METQKAFDFRPRESARATDPVTSVMAAEQIAPFVTHDRLAVLAVHYAQRLRAEGLDDFELAELMSRKQTSVGKRRGELERAGLIQKATRRASSSPLTTSIVQAYRITPAGREFYEKNR